jgi:hypothetical protein
MTTIVLWAVSVVETILVGAVAIVVSFSVMCYASQFVEERLLAFSGYSKIHASVIVPLSLLLLANFPWTVSLPTLLSNALWAFLIFTAFPVIPLSRPDFLLAVISTVLSHFFMMFHFLQHPSIGFSLIASYFALYVWSLPCLILVSLSTLDDADEHDAEEQKPSKGQSAWAVMLNRLLKRARDSLPRAGMKCD